jgi:hypothetical protein
MKRYFICLANSKKYGERCIAGIELERGKDMEFDIVWKEGKPKWIRPVSDAEHGQIPEKAVKSMQLFDIFEVEVVSEAPKGYQSENVVIDLKSLLYIKSVEVTGKRLDLLSEKEQKVLFDSHPRAVGKEGILAIKHSLQFIRVENASIYLSELRETEQYRINFTFEENNYNMPVTDVNFLLAFKENPNLLENCDTVYVTVSLGIEHKERYYKLAAGIILVV